MTLNNFAIFNDESNETFAKMLLTETSDNLHTVFFLATRKIRFEKFSRLAIFTKFRNNRERLMNIVIGNDKEFKRI